MNTIADVIVAAAAGKSRRVAVGCAHPDEVPFADHLTQALHARGRPSRCVRPKTHPGAADGSTTSSGRADDPTVVVITSGAQGPGEAGLCRIDIRLHAPAEPSAPAGTAHCRPGAEAQWSVGDDREPDIVVDYLHPDRPTISHICPP